MNQRKRRSLRGRLARLAKNNCANYKANPRVECEMTMCKLCIVQIETDSMIGNVCPYFMRSVLPADPELERDYLEHFPKGYRSKSARCEKCKTAITPTNNRQKYCASCAKTNEAENRKIRNRKYRERTRNKKTI